MLKAFYSSKSSVKSDRMIVNGINEVALETSKPVRVPCKSHLILSDLRYINYVSLSVLNNFKYSFKLFTSINCKYLTTYTF